jgi:PEP-CTERM motif
MNLRYIAAASVAFCLATVAHAATVITFEESPNGLTAMVNSPGTAVPLASQLTTQYLASSGVSFTSLAGYAALVNHGAGNPTASIPNIIGGTASDGRLNYNDAITISFFDIANTSVKAVTDSFKIQGDWVPLGTGQVFATAFDADGNPLASTSDTDNKVFGVSGPVLQFSIAGIHSVVISGNNGTVGFDQLEYGTLLAVPEPGTWALLAVGLALCWASRVVGHRQPTKAAVTNR